MWQKIVNPIGNIPNEDNHMLLNIWNVVTLSGTHPLIRHQHLFFEIMMLDSGSGKYTTDSVTYSIAKGEAFVLPICNSTQI